MAPDEQADLLDDQTVWMLKQGSWRDPRDYLRDCTCCGRPFWVHGGVRTEARYCSHACCARRFYHTHPDYRAGSIARAKARYQRERARRAA